MMNTLYIAYIIQGYFHLDSKSDHLRIPRIPGIPRSHRCQTNASFRGLYGIRTRSIRKVDQIVYRLNTEYGDKIRTLRLDSYALPYARPRCEFPLGTTVRCTVLSVRQTRGQH